MPLSARQARALHHHLRPGERGLPRALRHHPLPPGRRGRRDDAKHTFYTFACDCFSERNTRTLTARARSRPKSASILSGPAQRAATLGPENSAVQPRLGASGPSLPLTSRLLPAHAASITCDGLAGASLESPRPSTTQAKPREARGEPPYVFSRRRAGACAVVVGVARLRGA